MFCTLGFGLDLFWGGSFWSFIHATLLDSFLPMLFFFNALLLLLLLIIIISSTYMYVCVRVDYIWSWITVVSCYVGAGN